MARVTKIFTAGKIGPLISYEFRGKPCVRAKPLKVRQTKATKASARLFGKAAQLSRLLREGLISALPEPKEKDMMYRLNNTLFRWLQAGMPDSTLMTSDPSAITAFEFNLQSELAARVKMRPTVDWVNGKSIITIPKLIPSLAINAPAHTTAMRWSICMAGCSVTDSCQAWTAEASIDMPYNNKEVPAQQIELGFKIPRKSITLMVISLTYIKEGKGRLKANDVVDKNWLPCGVIGVCVK